MHQSQGQIIGGAKPLVTLQPIGQAQMWKGDTYGLLWEGYFFQTQRGSVDWLAELAAFWQAVEQDMGVNQIFTEPQDPDFGEGYTDFLRRLGYGPNPNFDRWWSKGS